MNLCALCAIGPRGGDGHRDLHHDVLAEKTSPKEYAPIFICAGCRCVWRKRYVGGGVYIWELRPTG